MKKTNIFFVYGHGDGPDGPLLKKLCKILDTKKFNIYSDYYAQYSPDKALYDIEHYIEELDIDILIGEELGGYLVSLVNNEKITKKILIDTIIDAPLELSEYETIVVDEETKEEKVIKLVPDHVIKFYKDSELKPNFDDCLLISTTEDSIEKMKQINREYKESLKDINELL